jgi:hypothetical protein
MILMERARRMPIVRYFGTVLAVCGMLSSTVRRATLSHVCAVPMIVAVLLLWSSAAAPGITINVTYSEDVVPAYDMDGSKLLALAVEAASIWAGYFPNNSFSISIDFCYENLDPGILGNADSTSDDISIQASPSSPWFIDSTPWDHSEFDFTGSGTPDNDYIGQTLFRNVGTVNQGAWFNGPVPDLFEIGYRGTAVAPEAQGRFDMFSTVIHEIGHILGVNFDPLDETWDPPAFQLGGNSIEIEPDPDDSGHLAARSSLMCMGCGDTDLRRMPSAVDILAVAADESWLEVDLPRQDFLTGATWNNLAFVSGWEGGQPPDQNDDAYIRHGGEVTLATSPSVANLYVGENSGVFTGAHTLTVGDLTIVEALLFEPPYAHITVETGGKLEGFRLILRGGRLVMAGGEVDFTAVDVENNSSLPAEVHGHGTVLAGALVNDGVVRADGGTLTLNVIVANLDGASDAGLVEAISGDIVVIGIVPDFQSVMTIGAGHSIDMSVPWTLAKEGRLDLQGGAISADLTGATVIVQGEVDVDRLGVLATNTVVFDRDADVQVPDANDRLILDTDAFFMGGSYTGLGAIEQQGDQQFWEDTTVQVREFDWGNSFAGELHETYLNETVELTINSETTGTATNEYRGTMHVIGATLNVNLNSGWLLPRRLAGGAPAGTLHFNSGDANPPRVTGVPLTVEGFVRANGGLAHMDADFITTPTADIQSVSGAELLLKGHNTYAGGQLYGAGEIGQWGDTDVVANTTINTTFYDLDGDEAAPSATTIHPGVTFTINSQRIDKPAEFFDGLVTADGGTLVINTPGGWTIGDTGQIHLINNAGPAWVFGTHITANGTIQTTGGNEVFSTVTFTPSAVVQAALPSDILRLRGHTNYEGGSYIGGGGIIQDADAFVNAETGIHLGFFDMDGVSETNFIELHANLFLNVDRIDLADNRFNGIMEVTDHAELGVNTPERWEMAGTLNVAGAPNTRFRVSGAEAHLVTNVTVFPDNIIEFAADVSGDGNFVGGGNVVFLGGYSPGASPAGVQFDGDATFASASSLLMELNGATPGTDYDQLVVAGDVRLGGRLEVEFLTATFLPTLSQQFDLIVAAGMIDGEFANVDLPQYAGGYSLQWNLQYGVNFVRLELVDLIAGLSGDYNGNGVVDAADYTVWRDHLGQTFALANENPLAATPGIVDQEDYNFWKSRFGLSAGAGAISSAGELAAVPEPAGWTMLVVVMLAACLRRRLVAHGAT